jgi:hypothetical protein
MYEGIFVMALRCTPCKTGKENVYSEDGRRIFFRKAGIKMS